MDVGKDINLVAGEHSWHISDLSPPSRLFLPTDPSATRQPQQQLQLIRRRHSPELLGEGRVSNSGKPSNFLGAING